MKKLSDHNKGTIIMSSVVKDYFISSFHFFPPYHSALVHTFGTSFNKCGERGYTCLVPDLMGYHLFSSH